MKQVIKNKLLQILGVDVDNSKHENALAKMKSETRDSLLVLSTQLGEAVKAIEKIIASVE